MFNQEAKVEQMQSQTKSATEILTNIGKIIPESKSYNARHFENNIIEAVNAKIGEPKLDDSGNFIGRFSSKDFFDFKPAFTKTHDTKEAHHGTSSSVALRDVCLWYSNIRGLSPDPTTSDIPFSFMAMFIQGVFCLISCGVSGVFGGCA